MKIAYQHLLNRIQDDPSSEEISEKLFQLGHENTFENGIFDIDITPNRGDCLSVDGILRDLNAFYEVDLLQSIFSNKIDTLEIDFENKSKDVCPRVSFLKLEISGQHSLYSGTLREYFDDLKINKNNFFADISNYIAYETGQPVHCYDQNRMNGSFTLDRTKNNTEFETLLNKKITIKPNDLVFFLDNKVINLAGIMGGDSTACTKDTKCVLVECAFFNSEEIIGKSLKYDLQSEAAYKFERGVDPQCHNYVLRRFIQIVSEHALIENMEIFIDKNSFKKNKKLNSSFSDINKILGTKIEESQFKMILSRLGFGLNGADIEVPSYRSDVKSNNDIAEEVARSVGYDNIKPKKIQINRKKNSIFKSNLNEDDIKNLLVDNGFVEVINQPFTSEKISSSIKVDNPLDSNKNLLRTDLKNSLLQNLLYNERRQKDSIKIFEISDVYKKDDGISKKRILGLILSGRMGNNYNEFSKKIDEAYLKFFLSDFIETKNLKIQKISRDNLETKKSNEIIYSEIELDNFNENIKTYNPKSNTPNEFTKYKKISDLPSSSRDLSFSLDEPFNLESLDNKLMSFNHELLKDVYIFDFYKNEKINQIKIGYRFIFQSIEVTITELQVDNIMSDIIKNVLIIDGVKVPGYNQDINNAY